MTYLGIDIGTSGVKALLIDEHGRALGEAAAAAVERVSDWSSCCSARRIATSNAANVARCSRHTPR